MERQEYYKIYRQEICDICKNKMCESGKGVNIGVDKKTIYINCKDFMKDTCGSC